MYRRFKEYLMRDGQLNVVLFKMLGVGGVGISIVSAAYCVITQDYYSAVINAGAGCLALLLMYFVERTGRYLFGYVVVEIAVFMFFFSVLYFTGSGINGSMPYFFSFGLMFTFLMFEGKMLVVMESLLAVFYFCVFMISFRYPQLVIISSSSVSNEAERLVGVFLSSFAMGMIFLLYIWEYRKQKRIAEEANKAKSIFLANMSHEIRTPINAVLGFNEIILKNSTEEKTREFAGYIDQSGHRLLRVVNEILDFSKVESGNSELTPELFHLKELAEEMNSMMSIMAKNKSLAYHLDYDEKIQDLVLADREKLVRILTNLLSNAFKYTNEGDVSLHMRLRQSDEETQTIYFSVEDTGIGIRMADINNLFHAYERADLMKNRQIEGTGLGLAITEQLLHLLGGNIHVESTYGKGSTFSFEIKLQLGEEENLKEEMEHELHSFMAPEARILVVDDDEMNRRMMESFLDTLKISADFAESGKACLSMLEEKSYHLILMDYMMPEMDGAAAMEKIRFQESKTGAHTPIIVLTADVVDHADRKLLARGFDAFLSKPIDFALLKEMLLTYIPEDKVIRDQNALEQASISPEQYKACEELLTGSGIIFQEGMKLANGDYGQYLRIASFFVNNADTDMTHLQEAGDAEDLSDMRLYFHALKGKAGSVGAQDLKTDAERLENKCREEDLEYVLCSLDLVFLKWKRCALGLERLLETAKDLLTEKENKRDTQLDGFSFEDLKEELLRNLTLCEGKKAKAVAEHMLRQEAGEHCRKALTEILELIDTMEFETAVTKVDENLNMLQ